MTPTFPLKVAAGWQRLVAVFVTDVALLWAGSAVAERAGWWAGAATGAVVTLAALVSWRGAPLLTLLSRQAVLRAGVRKAAPAEDKTGKLADHQRSFDDGPMGIRAVGAHLVVVVAVEGPAHSPSVLDHHRVESLATLPVAAVAAGLRQFDVTLAGIDIVSVGSRCAPKTHHFHAPVYSGRVGDHPAMGQRRTWLVVRLNANDAVAAVLWRESVAATLGAAAQWLAQDLTSRRCRARVLSAAEIEQVDEALLAGTDPAGLRCGWGRLGHGGGYVHTYWVSPQDISSATIDRLWTPDTDATAVTVQLRPAPDGATTIGVLVRYHTGGPLGEPPLTGLNPFTGRHDLGLRAGLVAPTGIPTVPARPLAGGEHLHMPIGATGIIIGTTPAGHPLLIDLAAPDRVAAMTIAGELALTVQVALRAAATGYQVLVHTNRPQRWQQATAKGLQLVGAAGLGQQLPTSPRPFMVVYDQLSGPVPDGAAVTVHTVQAGEGSSADIHIEQDDARNAVIRTWAFRYRLRIDLDYERHLTAMGPRRAA